MYMYIYMYMYMYTYLYIYIYTYVYSRRQNYGNEKNVNLAQLSEKVRSGQKGLKLQKLRLSTEQDGSTSK